MKNKTLKYIAISFIFIFSKINAQKSDFIVNKTNDTIYVDKIKFTDFEVKTKTSDKKKKYKIDEIISYYNSKEDKYFERIPLEKKTLTKPNKYDYSRNENFHIEEYENRIKYKFIQRLTEGKVKLFCEVLKQTDIGAGTPGQPGYMPSYHSEDKIYYISINDSKLELINNKTEKKLIKKSVDLELNKEVYEILKIYLYGNAEITIKLDNLFSTKPIAKEKQIIDLINDYNIIVKSNK